MRQINLKKLSLIGLSLFLVPVAFGLIIMSVTRFWDYDGTPGEWLGYWGGIIGSILGIAGALLVFNEQLKNEKEISRISHVDNTFFNLLELHNQVKEKLGNKNIYDEIKNEIRQKEKAIISDKKEVFKQKLFKKNYDRIINVNKQLSEKDYSIVEYAFLNYPLDPKELYQYESQLDYELRDLRSEQAYYDFQEYLETEAKIVNEKKLLSEREYLIKVVEKDTSLVSIKEEIQCKNNAYSYVLAESEKKEIIQSIYNKKYINLGNYFRMFHRVIKYINNNVKEIEIKKDYLGFLRAMLSEDELLLIFYNAFYTKRGSGLKEELMYTSFFGSIKDLDTTESFTQHFNKSLLLWEEADINLMKECKLRIKDEKK